MNSFMLNLLFLCGFGCFLIVVLGLSCLWLKRIDDKSKKDINNKLDNKEND